MIKQFLNDLESTIKQLKLYQKNKLKNIKKTKQKRKNYALMKFILNKHLFKKNKKLPTTNKNLILN